MAKTVNKFMIAKIKAEVLEGIFNSLQFDLDNASKHYGKTGNKIQERVWTSTTKEYELCWEDDEHTIPVLVDEYGDIEYTDEELEERPEVLAKIEVIKLIMQKLENLL